MLTYDHARTGVVARARELRRVSTEAEKRLWRALRRGLPDYKWRRQMPIGPYFADFACFAEKLVIELDGGQHAEMADLDAARSRFLQAQGYRLIRFWNNEVIENLDGAFDRVTQALTSKGSEQ